MGKSITNRRAIQQTTGYISDYYFYLLIKIYNRYVE